MLKYKPQDRGVTVINDHLITSFKTDKYDIKCNFVKADSAKVQTETCLSYLWFYNDNFMWTLVYQTHVKFIFIRHTRNTQAYLDI